MGTPAAHLNVSDFYVADAWAAGPGPIYDRLSDEMLRGLDLRRKRVLDMGAGTGAATRAVQRAGGRAIAVDRSLEMLRHDAARRPPRAAADAVALPFANDAFDATVAAFVLSHLARPVSGLAEMARVTRPGGHVVVAQFAESNDHAAKAAVEHVAARYGFVRPAWYDAVKGPGEHAVASPSRLVTLARDAGLGDAEASERRVDACVHSADALVRWRLGIPAFAQFVASLGKDARTKLFDDAVAALGAEPEPYIPAIVVLRAAAR